MIIEDKYKELNNKKTSKEAAEIVSKVEKHSYLANPIRNMEFAISKLKNKNYHIITYATTMDKPKISFQNNFCLIRLLPYKYEKDGVDDKRMRFILACKLGQLMYNFKSLTNPKELSEEELKEINNKIPSEEEKRFAKEFAYNLVKMKTEEHENNRLQKKFAYKKDELKKELFELVKEKNLEIYEKVYNTIFNE